MQYSEQRHRGHTVRTQEEYLDYFDHYNSHIWAVLRKSDTGAGMMVGTITAHRNRDNKTANMGILIGPSGLGYGSEAWRLVSDWLLTDDCRKVEAGCMSNNLGMRKILDRCEFWPEAKITAHFLLDGKPEDLVLYGRMV